MVLDSQGNATAAWTTNVSTPAFHNVVMSAYRPAGGTWSAPVQVSAPVDEADNSEMADLGVAADGTVTAVWSIGKSSGPFSVKASSRAPGGAWSEPATLLSGASTFFPLPQVAVDPAGNATAVWRRFPGGPFVLEASTRAAGSATWSAPETLDTNSGAHDVAAGADGTVVAVWAFDDGGVQRIRARVRAPAGGWASPVTLSSPGTGDSSSPQVGAGGNGGFTVVWDRGTGAPNTYYVQANTRAANGFWAGATDVSVASLYSPGPDVAMDAAGNATAVWHRYDGVSFYLRASQRPAGGSWTPPVDVSAATQTFNGTALAMDAAGTTRLAWSAFEGGHYVVRTVGSAFQGPWSAPVPLSNPTEDTFRLALAVDPVGNAVLAWERSPSAGNGIVEALGLDGAGPTVSAFSAPPTAPSGTTLTYAANATDAWSAVTGYSWSFGDGASAAGPIVSHAYAAAGSYPVTLTVTDAVGNTTTRSATTTVTAVPSPVPAITTFKLKKRTIATDRRPSSRSASPSPRP